MVHRQEMEVVTPDGRCPAVVVTPDGDGPWPAVLVFADAGGVRPAMIEIAGHIAAMGYVAFLPELYYRHGPYRPLEADTVFTDPDERARLGSMAASVTYPARHGFAVADNPTYDPDAAARHRRALQELFAATL